MPLVRSITQKWLMLSLEYTLVNSEFIFCFRISFREVLMNASTLELGHLTFVLALLTTAAELR